MKKLLLFLSISASSGIYAQCSVSAYLNYGDCYNNCGGTGFATGMGAGPLSYSWSNGTTGYNVSGLCRDSTYVVTLTDNVGCIATDTLTVPFDSIAYSNTVVNTSCPTCCDGSDTINISFFSPPPCDQLSYQWTPGSGFPSAVPYQAGMCVGTYTVMVTTNCGCYYGAVITVGYNTATGVAETPAAEIIYSEEGGFITISSTDPVLSMEVIDSKGSVVLHSTGTTAMVNELRAGVYFIAVTTSRTRTVRKILRR